MATALRLSADTQDLEEDWDPQGLNSLDKEVLESFGSTEDDVENEGAATASDGAPENEEGEMHSDDLDRDGLTELEEMERLLKNEESPLDFAMVAEEE